jgi:hypothetical protein
MRLLLGPLMQAVLGAIPILKVFEVWVSAYERLSEAPRKRKKQLDQLFDG